MSSFRTRSTQNTHQLPGLYRLLLIKLFQVNLGWSAPSDSDLFFSFISCDLIPAGWNPEQDQPVTTEISIHIYFVGWNFFHSPIFPFNINTYNIYIYFQRHVTPMHFHFSIWTFHIYSAVGAFLLKKTPPKIYGILNLHFLFKFFSFVAFSIRIRTF